jgi:hypothetical protein
MCVCADTCNARADQGIATTEMDAEDPAEMLKQFDEKFCRMETTMDFFTPELYKKYINIPFHPKQLVFRGGKYGILRTRDNIFREGVPQIYEGVTTGMA